MINLLPPEQKIELLTEQKFKLVLILEVLVLLFLVSIVLILFSITLYVSGLIESQVILADLEQEQYEKSQIRDMEKKIELINKIFSDLSSFYQKQDSVTHLLEKISKSIPSEIDLNNFQLTPAPSGKEKEYTFRISFSGSAPNREILYQLKKNLEAEEGFKEIYLAISSWIEPADFNLTFEVQ